ncbi:MAG: phage capsid protein [Solirubrobacterales bacterium]|nr:phage capsid protein [Solirubrobacterales bacterium]
MAVLTAQGISRVAIALLVRQLSLPRTVTMVPGAEFAGSNGDTITVRVRQPRAARTQTNAEDELTPDAQDEIGVDVTLHHLYDLFNLSDQDANLNLEDFASQVTEPQVNAVAIGAEDELVTVMNALAADATIEFAATATDDDTIAQILAAREFLGDHNCPPSERFFAVAPDIASRILSIDTLMRVDASGSSDALRDAVIGRLFGFTFVEAMGLDEGTAVAYHRSGFAFATRVPSNPRGAASSAATVAQGIGLRQVFQYDPTHARDQSLVSTFAGAAAVYDDASGTDNQRFVKIGTAT